MVARRNVTNKANNNSILAKLKLVEETPERFNGKDAVSKFLEALDRQEEYVDLELEGKPLPMAGGEERTRKPNLWYFQKKGRYYLTVRYGTILMDMSGDKKMLDITDLDEYAQEAQATLSAGTTLKDVKNTLHLIREAVTSGELKPFILHVASMISDRLSKSRNR